MRTWLRYYLVFLVLICAALMLANFVFGMDFDWLRVAVVVGLGFVGGALCEILRTRKARAR